MEIKSSGEKVYRFAVGVVLSAFALVALSAAALYWYREALHVPVPAADTGEGVAVAEADRTVGNGGSPAVEGALPENGGEGVVLGAYASTTAESGAASDTAAVAVYAAISDAILDATSSASSSSDPYASSDEDCL